MRVSQFSLMVTSNNSAVVDVPAIREAVRKICLTAGFGNPSFEGIRFRFTESLPKCVRLTLCELTVSAPQSDLDSARRIVAQAGSLLSSMLNGKCEVVVDIREIGG